MSEIYTEDLPFKGLTLKKIHVDRENDDCIYFQTVCNRKFKMYHEQDCCESVYIEDINGDLDDLIGKPLIVADVRTHEHSDSDYESMTWTFYKLGTSKGFVDIRWLGESNGYYSESVYVAEVEYKKDWPFDDEEDDELYLGLKKLCDDHGIDLMYGVDHIIFDKGDFKTLAIADLVIQTFLEDRLAEATKISYGYRQIKYQFKKEEV